MKKELDLEKDARTQVDSRHVLALEQRVVLVKDNVDLNRLT